MFSIDLFIVVFFAMAMSAGFIVGKHQSMKVIVGCYIAIIATQGLGLITTMLMGNSSELLQSVGIPVDATMIALGKLFLFALFATIFIIRGRVDVSYDKAAGTILDIVSTVLLGFSAAALIASTVLTYVSGSGILESALIIGGAISPAVQHAMLAQVLIVNQGVWYALPAFVLIAMGLLHDAE